MATRWRPSAAKSQAKESTVDDWENDQDEDQQHHQEGESAQANQVPEHDSEAWPTLNGAAAMGPKILKRNAAGSGANGSSSRDPM